MNNSFQNRFKEGIPPELEKVGKVFGENHSEMKYRLGNNEDIYSTIKA